MSVVSRVPRADLVLEEAKRRARGAGPAVALGEARGQLRARPFLRLGQPGLVLVKSAPSGSNGPIAPIDEAVPVIVLAASGLLFEKTVSTMQEVRARGGELYVFADAGSEIPESEGVHILHMPEHYGMLSPVLHVIPLQLLSYHAALVKGTDVDKPRNLAKSVTVE